MSQERMSKADLARFLPPGARYVAMDQSGRWQWYSTVPTPSQYGSWTYSASNSGPHQGRLAVLPDIDLSWDKSLVEIRPKVRWRAQVGETYWFVNGYGAVLHAVESNSVNDDDRHACGNYWFTDTQARACADAEKALRMKLHEAEEGA